MSELDLDDLSFEVEDRFVEVQRRDVALRDLIKVRYSPPAAEALNVAGRLAELEGAETNSVPEGLSAATQKRLRELDAED